MTSNAATAQRSFDHSVFAALPSGRRTWAVAAIRGEVRRLINLHDRLATRLAIADHLVYLGNFLGRGGDVAATVQELLLFRRALMARAAGLDGGSIVHLRGSQEEMWHKLLQVQFAANPREVLDWMLDRGVGATISAYGGAIADGRTAAKRGALALSRWTNGLRQAMRARDGHQQLISALKRAAFSDDGTLLFVSAGVDPSRPLESQHDAFWWGTRAFESSDAPYDGFTRIVRGAAPRHYGVIVGASKVSIDGGCGDGGPLIAACFNAVGDLVDVIEA
jgi:serine/threonine protein phosphatase 1